jgi:Tol biopolymer transport system component
MSVPVMSLVRVRSLVVLLALTAQAAVAQDGRTTLASVTPGGEPGNGASTFPALSADGRFVAFASLASDLVGGDTNGASDIFVRDLRDGVTTRASVSSTGSQGDAASGEPSLSADGRFVAFASGASNLVPADTNGLQDIFVHDVVTGETVRASVGSSGEQKMMLASQPSLSADGTSVSFTWALPGAAVHVHHLETGQTKLASFPANSVQTFGNSTISGDGLTVSYELDCDELPCNFVWVSKLATGTQSFEAYIFEFTDGESALSVDGRSLAYSLFGTTIRNLDSGVETLVSISTAGVAGTAVGRPAISADNRFVAFTSHDSALVPADTNDAYDTYVHDRLMGTTVRVSISSDGSQGDGSSGFRPALSADGRSIAFDSAAGNLVAGDTAGHDDVFVHDRGQWTDIGGALPGVNGDAVLSGTGSLVAGSRAALDLVKAAPDAVAILFAAQQSQPVSFKGGVLEAFPILVIVTVMTDGVGAAALAFTWPAGLPAGSALFFQYAIDDAAAIHGVALSNAVEALNP